MRKNNQMMHLGMSMSTSQRMSHLKTISLIAKAVMVVPLTKMAWKNLYAFSWRTDHLLAVTCRIHSTLL